MPARPSTSFGARNFTSQCHQDAWAYDNVFHPLLAAGATNDVAAPTFVEFGARDGKRNSNSYFFEKSLGWRGLLVEARCVIRSRPLRRLFISLPLLALSGVGARCVDC